jgi:hypothetical protein
VGEERKSTVSLSAFTIIIYRKEKVTVICLISSAGFAPIYINFQINIFKFSVFLFKGGTENVELLDFSFNFFLQAFRNM